MSRLFFSLDFIHGERKRKREKGNILSTSSAFHLTLSRKERKRNWDRWTGWEHEDQTNANYFCFQRNNPVLVSVVVETTKSNFPRKYEIGTADLYGGQALRFNTQVAAVTVCANDSVALRAASKKSSRVLSALRTLSISERDLIFIFIVISSYRCGSIFLGESFNETSFRRAYTF